MNWQDLLNDGFGRVLEDLGEALTGFNQEDIQKMPGPDSNSMGWLSWHLTRVQDAQVSELAGKKQTYISEGWYTKFGRAPDSSDTGFGHSPEQVSSFWCPPADVFVGYYRAVLESTRAYVNSLNAEDLDRELNEPWFQPLPTVGVRLISIMSDCLQHTGQVAYIRGLLEGKGWLGY